MIKRNFKQISFTLQKNPVEHFLEVTYFWSVVVNRSSFLKYSFYIKSFKCVALHHNNNRLNIYSIIHFPAIWIRLTSRSGLASGTPRRRSNPSRIRTATPSTCPSTLASARSTSRTTLPSFTWPSPSSSPRTSTWPACPTTSTRRRPSSSKDVSPLDGERTDSVTKQKAKQTKTQKIETDLNKNWTDKKIYCSRLILTQFR